MARGPHQLDQQLFGQVNRMMMMMMDVMMMKQSMMVVIIVFGKYLFRCNIMVMMIMLVGVFQRFSNENAMRLSSQKKLRGLLFQMFSHLYMESIVILF